MTDADLGGEAMRESAERVACAYARDSLDEPAPL